MGKIDAGERENGNLMCSLKLTLPLPMKLAGTSAIQAAVDGQQCRNPSARPRRRGLASFQNQHWIGPLRAREIGHYLEDQAVWWR